MIWSIYGLLAAKDENKPKSELGDVD